jgi:head-tail adaptor
VTPAGKRNRRISLHTSVAVGENSFGEPTKSADLPRIGGAWARVVFGKGSERREAAIEKADLVATFIVLSRQTTRAIAEGHVIRFAGKYWDITGIAPWEREEIEITAICRRAT